MARTLGQRRRARQSAVAAAHRPDLSKYRDGAEVVHTPPITEHRDWPEIRSTHPHWWQVRRIEAHGDQLVFVLVHETPNEEQAFRVALSQYSQSVITKWNDKQPPYYTSRAPKIVRP